MLTIESAEAEYKRLLSIRATPEELWAEYDELCKAMDRLNIAHNNICDNDNKGEPWP